MNITIVLTDTHFHFFACPPAAALALLRGRNILRVRVVAMSVLPATHKHGLPRKVETPR